MPDAPFRLMVVGLLFMLVGRVAALDTGDVMTFLGVLNWTIGSGFVIFGFLDWIQERRARAETHSRGVQ